jgi:DivIVA domain-containing protein
VEQDSIERIRSTTFAVARRGYDKREVDTFLARLADWLEAGGGDRARSDTIKRELERIGQRTGKILGAAEEAAEAIRGDAQAEATDLMQEARVRADSTRASADKYAKETRGDADEYAQRVRSEADDYSQTTREEADAYSEETRTEAERAAAEVEAEAKANAERVVAEGTHRRREIEKLISDLEKRRDAALAGIEQLRSELAGAATHHSGPVDAQTETRKMTRQAEPEAEEPAAAP